MQIAVWDTYVERSNGARMHFDILVPAAIEDENQIYEYGDQYLKRCNFCHIENASTEIEAAIRDKGFYILEMENCC